MSARADIARHLRAEALDMFKGSLVPVDKMVWWMDAESRVGMSNLEMCERLKVERPQVYASILGEYEYRPDPVAMVERMVAAMEEHYA